MLADAEPPAYRRKPAQDCEARRITQAQANSLSLVQFDTKRYSVPVKYAHRTITMVATFDDVKLVFEDRLIARHRRHWGREQYFFDPIHYPALLERKPGAFDYARPLADWQLPECFNVLRRRMERTPDGVDGGRKRRRGDRVAAVQNGGAQPCRSLGGEDRGDSPDHTPFQREAQECTATWRFGARFAVRC
jgi:hypothetical protein